MKTFVIERAEDNGLLVVRAENKDEALRLATEYHGGLLAIPDNDGVIVADDQPKGVIGAFFC